jgi:DNA-binding transcriptional LysR family regulator
MAFDTRLLGGLRALVAVIESGNFVRAGEAIGLTQSGVSRAIQRLEQQLKVRLLDRSSHAVALTDEGLRFYQEIGPLLTQMEDAVLKTGKSSQAVRGRLRVNVDAHFASLFLAPHIGSFLEMYPELSVEVVVREEMGDLISEGFDAAVRFGEPESSSLIARRLVGVRVITCASPKYLARRGTPTHPRDLEKDRHECILFRDPLTRRPFPWEFHQGRKVITVSVKGRLVVNDAMTYLAACNAGLGVAQIFDWGRPDIASANQLVKLFPSWSDEHWPLHAYHLSRHHSPAKVGAFMDFIASLITREI